MEPEEFARRSEAVDRFCEGLGRDPAAISRSVNLHFHMGANAADAARIARERPLAYGAITGTPQQAIERIAAFAERGVAQVNVAIRPPVEWDALHAFAEEVIPAFS